MTNFYAEPGERARRRSQHPARHVSHATATRRNSNYDDARKPSPSKRRPNSLPRALVPSPRGRPLGAPPTAGPRRSAHSTCKCTTRPTTKATARPVAGPGADRRPAERLNTGQIRWLYPFPPHRFHVLFNSLFKVLCNFPSQYLFAIGFVGVFSLR